MFSVFRRGGRYRGCMGCACALLQGLASCLVVDEPPGDFQYVCVLGWHDRPSGYRCYDTAVQLCRKRPSCGVLVIEPRPERLVEIGVLPSFETLSRRELESRGVPRRAISVLRTDGCDDWATARDSKRGWPIGRTLVRCCSARNFELPTSDTCWIPWSIPSWPLACGCKLCATRNATT